MDIEENLEHSVSCVHSLVPSHRWLGTKSMTRTGLKLTSPIIAYNLFMNSVDRCLSIL